MYKYKNEISQAKKRKEQESGRENKKEIKVRKSKNKKE